MPLEPVPALKEGNGKRKSHRLPFFRLVGGMIKGTPDQILFSEFFDQSDRIQSGIPDCYNHNLI